MWKVIPSQQKCEYWQNTESIYYLRLKLWKGKKKLLHWKLFIFLQTPHSLSPCFCIHYWFYACVGQCVYYSSLSCLCITYQRNIKKSHVSVFILKSGKVCLSTWMWEPVRQYCLLLQQLPRHETPHGGNPEALVFRCSVLFLLRLVVFWCLPLFKT